MEKRFIVRWQATMIGSNTIAHIGATEVIADTEQEALKIVLNTIRIVHPEYGTIQAEIVKPQEPEKKETEEK